MPLMEVAGPPGPCNGTAIRKASRRISQLYDKALEPSGLRATQYSILAELERRGRTPPTMGELAEALIMDRSALGHTLRPLERDKLISLKAGGADSRCKYVVITARGRAKWREARQLWCRAQAYFESLYGEENAKKLRATLLTIANDERFSDLEK
jgi:DNA-binding MarR family transcriptional regulator